MSTISYKDGINFTHSVIQKEKPTILRGEFYRGSGAHKLGIALEITRPTMEEAVDAISSYARLVADGIK